MMRLLVLGLAFVGFVAATCPDNTVTSEEHCRDLCVAIHSTTDISFTVTHSTKECHCIVGELDIQVCTTTTTTTTTTASPTTSPYVPPTRAEIRAELVDLFGWPCIESINSAITDNYTDCSADFDTDDHTELESTAWDYFNDLCVDRCIPIFVNSVNILLESNCFRPNEQDLTNPLLFRLNLFKILEGKVTMGCALASTTGDYCGGVLTPLTSFVQNSSQIRRNHCEAVSDRGYCLGTILRAGEENMDWLKPFIPSSHSISSVICDFASHCRQLDEDGILNAAAFTEELAAVGATPAASTSSATALLAATTMIATTVACTLLF